MQSVVGFFCIKRNESYRISKKETVILYCYEKIYKKISNNIYKKRRKKDNAAYVIIMITL